LFTILIASCRRLAARCCCAADTGRQRSDPSAAKRLLRRWGQRALRATQKLTVIASAPKGREAISVQVRDCFVGLLRRPPRNDNKVSGFTHIAARRYGVLVMTEAREGTVCRKLCKSVELERAQTPFTQELRYRPERCIHLIGNCPKFCARGTKRVKATALASFNQNGGRTTSVQSRDESRGSDHVPARTTRLDTLDASGRSSEGTPLAHRNIVAARLSHLEYISAVE
jgi:hypothetical protein